MSKPLDLFLFTVDPIFGRTTLSAGISAFVVDWEQKGKTQRQVGFDTEINTDYRQRHPNHGVATRISSRLQNQLDGEPNSRGSRQRYRSRRNGSHVADGRDPPGSRTLHGMCRRQGFGRHPGGNGRRLQSCERVCFPGRRPGICGTERSVHQAGGRNNIFEPFIDGAVDRLREIFHSIPFGVGGLTVVDKGAPVPCLRLMEEYARIEIDFTFLRRSFKKDIVGRDMRAEIDRVNETWNRLLDRDPAQVRSDHERFVPIIKSLSPFTS